MVFLTEASSSSSSSPTYDKRYDVFLSFRGFDTRLSFTNHLHTALVNANLTTFLDDQEIELGLCLKPELETAIRSSRASIIVLSKNYASSTWCLNELVLILEQHRNSDHIVIPVFYHVEPTDLRNQQNTFGDAMAKHIQRMQAEPNAEKRSQWVHKIELWKNALTEVAGLKGKDAKGRLETEFIEEIVNDIYHRLALPLRTTLPLLIGMDYNIKLITSWIKDRSSNTADILTIVGIGGIGKTSLAKYVYGLHCRAYTSSFIEDISRRCTQPNGLFDVQMQLCRDISKSNLIQVQDVFVYTSTIENALVRKKVFVALDDIDSPDQLDVLLGNKGFHPGSKIIITTKDASLIKRCSLFNPQAQPKLTKVVLKGLYEAASLELLCLHAFKCRKPNEGYIEVSKKLVKYCEGHPLALQVLGKSLHNRDVDEWEDYIERLKIEPHSLVKKALQISFDSLPFENDKDLFKHIACFFVGMDRDFTETILKACDINTRTGITNLIDRCLLSIGLNNKLMMHQLIQEMGRDIVRQESPGKPWKRSRLWCHEESFKVLKKKKGKGNLLGLVLDLRMLDKKKLRGSFELKTDALNRMENLMLLQLNYVRMNGPYQNFPEELRWLCMHGFPLKSIPSDLRMENLVALDMSYSNIESFGLCYGNPLPLGSRQKLVGSCSHDKPLLGSLKILDLSFCEQLHSVGGFLELPKLERLIVRKCIILIEICDTIEKCVELELIDLSYCCKLRKLPISVGKLKKVKTLLLDGCDFSESRIYSNGNMNSPEMLVANKTGINSRACSPGMQESIPRDLKSLAISLPSSLVSLSLKANNLSNESFPMDFSCLSMLKKLCLDGNPIVSMPDCVRSLPRLEILGMNDCKMLMSIEHPPCTLRHFSLLYYGGSYTILLQKIVFSPGMSPLKLILPTYLLSPSSIEIEGMIKIQPMASVEDNIISSLGWTNLEFVKKCRIETHNYFRGAEESQSQMYYEFGIFSTFYGGRVMPNWITHRRKEGSISITIPSSRHQLRGLNICYLELLRRSRIQHTTYGNRYKFYLPMIIISNITKNLTWIYKHYLDNVHVDNECLIFLSHWLFGINEMEGGDQVTITREQPGQLTEWHRVGAQVTRDCGVSFGSVGAQVTRECGVSFVYDDGNMEEKDALGYYKSWNHIIGGDLSAFQATSGEYFLDTDHFTYHTREISSRQYPLIGDGAGYKGMTSHIRNYRPWTSIEEAKLVEALVNMTNARGFKADNGFKSGYLQHLEQALNLSLPNSGILGNPHIVSKIKTMKKDWQCVYDMVNGSNTSGFGYDHIKHCVTAEEPVWEAYLQVHKNAARYKHKTFPYYENLCIVFGKDRAQENRAKDFVEMEQEVNL